MDYEDTCLQRAAVGFAQQGMHVFPLRPGSKMPHPGSRGEKDGSDDPNLAERRWGSLVGSNIGWALRYNNVFVLDIDERNGGCEWLDGRPALPETIQVITPSRGRGGHWWFWRPPTLEGVRCKGLAAGVDLKGLAFGYVLLPPSAISARSLPYEWSGASVISQPPDWLVHEILGKKTPPPPAPRSAEPRVAPWTVRGLQAFEAEGLLGKEIKPGLWTALCPNRQEHSERRRDFAGDTVIFVHGKRAVFYCSHSHCYWVNERFNRGGGI